MKSVAVILAIGLCLIGIFFWLKKCTGFVSSIDGERNSKMINIVEGYYYNESDFKIWEREDATDSYKKLIDSKVDSLAWNNHYILGQGNHLYFIIDVKNSVIRYSSNQDSLRTFFKVAGRLNTTFPFIPSVTQPE